MSTISIAVLFLAALFSVSAMPQGWGPPPPPPGPVIDLELSGEVALAGAGAASAGQQVSEQAVGNAQVISLNGVAAGAQQEGDVLQVASADLSGWSPVTSTIQAVSGSNEVAAVDQLQAIIVADELAAVDNSAATYAEGIGAVAASAESVNQVIFKKN